MGKPIRSWSLTAIVVFMQALAVSAHQATVETVPLVVDGQAHAALVLPRQPHADLRLAAREIQNNFEIMSGAKLHVTSGTLADGVLPIYLGLSFIPDATETIKRQGDDPASFMIRVKRDGVYIAGLSPEGTLFGAYELLEQLGVRWYLPGELGTVIPQAETIVLTETQSIHVPSFRGRHLTHGVSRAQSFSEDRLRCRRP